MRDVNKLGNSWQASGQVCGTAKKSGVGKRERWKDFPSRESEKRQLVVLRTQWRFFQLLPESLTLSSCLYCLCLLVEGREYPHHMLPCWKTSLPSQPWQSFLKPGCVSLMHSSLPWHLCLSLVQLLPYSAFPPLPSRPPNFFHLLSNFFSWQDAVFRQDEAFSPAPHPAFQLMSSGVLSAADASAYEKVRAALGELADL